MRVEILHTSSQTQSRNVDTKLYFEKNDLSSFERCRESGIRKTSTVSTSLIIQGLEERGLTSVKLREKR